MPSEWAIATARALAYGMQQHIAIAEALDAARAQGRREGLEEAAIIVATAGRYVYAQDTEADIRRRIALEPKV